MVSLDITLRAVAALTSCVFAFVAVAAGWRRPSHQYFAAFLLLVAGNQVGEAFSSATDPASYARLFWLAFAFACAALDPVLLYLVATSRPSGEFSRRGELLVILAFSFLIVGLTPFVFAQYDEGLIERVKGILGIFTAVVYMLALRRFLVRLARGRSMSRGASALLAGLFVIVLPALTRSVDQSLRLLVWAMGWPDSVIHGLNGTVIPLHLALVGAFVFLARAGLSDDAKRGVSGPAFQRAIYISVGVLVLIDFRIININLALWGVMPSYEALGIFGRTGAALRWILVGAFLSSAILRHQALGLKFSTRRHAARILVALALIESGILIAFAVDLLRPGALTPAEGATITFLLVAVLISHGFHRLVDRFAERVYDVPPADDIVALHEVYRRAATAAHAQGFTIEAANELERLRAELDIDEAVAAAIDRALGEVGESTLTPGRLVASRYRVIEIISQQETRGTVLAEDTLLARPVLLDQYALPADASRFLTRARAYGSLRGAHLIPVEDFIMGAGETFVVLGGVESDSLRSWCVRDSLTPAERYRAARAILDAVASLHETGYTHGRLTLDAFIVRGDGSVALRDLALDAPPASRREDVAAVSRLVSAITSPETLAPRNARDGASIPELRKGLHDDGTSESPV